MPSVNLTPQQQATIDAANAKLASAKSALDAATSDAQSRLGDLNRCNCGKGKRIGGMCTPLKTKYEFPNLGNISDCVESPNINKCRTDCCEQDTCKQRVTTYNNSISVYNAAKTNFSTAQANLQSTLDAIAKDPTIDANAGIINNEIAAQKSNDNLKWLFFGLAAVIIVGAAIFIGIKVLKGGASA